MTKELWNKLVISKLVSKMGQTWNGTEHLNLTEFYANTRPKYLMAHCMLEYIDCRQLWEVRSKSQVDTAMQIKTFSSYENGIVLGVGFSESYRTI